MSHLIPQYSKAFGHLHEPYIGPTETQIIDRLIRQEQERLESRKHTLEKRVEEVSSLIERKTKDINERQTALNQMKHDCNNGKISINLEIIKYYEEEYDKDVENLSYLGLKLLERNRALAALIQVLNES